MAYYIHKHEISQEYGGPEEGGWWYTKGEPVLDWKPDEFENMFMHASNAYRKAQELNTLEEKRRHDEEDFPYHSVLSYRCRYYSYSVSESPTQESYPEETPHYE